MHISKYTPSFGHDEILQEYWQTVFSFTVYLTHFMHRLPGSKLLYDKLIALLVNIFTFALYGMFLRKEKLADCKNVHICTYVAM